MLEKHYRTYSSVNIHIITLITSTNSNIIQPFSNHPLSSIYTMSLFLLEKNIMRNIST
jgi:hypothetical protein